MARIRTIKPEFFSSEDIVSLSFAARLLYQALWCEADREGRMEWKPFTFKLRYFPGDDIRIQELCNELTQRGLVVLYGEVYAYIPKFQKHQHVNPRESVSQLPDPHADSSATALPTRQAPVTDAQGTDDPRVTDASARVDDAQGGREGKGRERKEIDIANAMFVSVKPPTNLAQLPPPCPFDELMAMFTRHLPMLPVPRQSLFKAGKGANAMRTRWRWVLTEKYESGERTGQRMAVDEAEGLAWFDRFFEFVSESDFLTGRNGKWAKCTLGWLMESAKFEAVLASTYHGKTGRST